MYEHFIIHNWQHIRLKKKITERDVHFEIILALNGQYEYSKERYWNTSITNILVKTLSTKRNFVRSVFMLNIKIHKINGKCNKKLYRRKIRRPMHRSIGDFNAWIRNAITSRLRYVCTGVRKQRHDTTYSDEVE